jgi:hypothetical protein
MGRHFDSHLRSLNFCPDLLICAIITIDNATLSDAYLDPPQISSTFLNLHGVDSTFVDFPSSSNLLDCVRNL